MCGSTRNVARVARPFPSTIKLSITKQERGKGLAGQTNSYIYLKQPLRSMVKSVSIQSVLNGVDFEQILQPEHPQWQRILVQN